MAVSISGYSQETASADVKSQIEKNSKQMQKHMEAGNLAEFGSYFAEDAMLKLSGFAPMSGREAITAAHKPMTEQGMKLVINTEEVMDFGDYAYEIGNYEMHNKEGMKVDHGHYSTLWKKADGEWKIYRDMVSSSAGMK
ncbi:hypothetical protein LPB144_05750 [Christiangramia salexigens]|uniref:DUF4440 domain-containing protein n=1 Tax=Christiangramia salexigens TaxID=1913577 RepID=A0A1L3J4B1_9FLAO|nr:hypothetical protein LPB144_05750 [Christiangramia salexigens]